MRTVKLSEDREVAVRIYHTEEQPRKTVVSVESPDGVITFAYAEARCGSRDKFVKAFGRKLAARRVLEQLRNNPSAHMLSSDRAAIFYAVCPEYKK